MIQKLKRHKKIIIISLLVVAVLIVALILSSCSNSSKTKEKFEDRIIELRDSFFVASDDNYTATLMGGLREENYALDGKVSPLIDFAIITFIQNDSLSMSYDELPFSLKIGEEYHTGKLLKSDLDNSYMIDLGINLNEDAIMELSIDVGDYKFNKTLECKSKEFNIKQDQAMNIAVKELGDKFYEMCSNNAEAYVRIMKDYSDKTNETYYWYIAVVSSNGDTAGILIDCSNGNVISKKI